MTGYRIQSTRISRQQEAAVTSVNIVEEAGTYLERFKTRFWAPGKHFVDGRPMTFLEFVARKIGCSPGTLENIHRRRLKFVDGGLIERLRSFIRRQYEREMEALQHELEMVRTSCARARRIQVPEVEAALDKARALLAEIDEEA